MNPRPCPTCLYPATPLAGVEPVVTPAGGLLVFTALPGQYLEAGQLIAEVIRSDQRSRHPVHCSAAGLMYARSLRRMATAGMVIAHVAGTEAIAAAIYFRLEDARPMYRLTIEGLHKSYGDHEVLKVFRSRPVPAMPSA